MLHLGNPAKEFNNLAVSHIVPAGWEIINERLGGEHSSPDFIYQDIRDDRIFTFIKLQPGLSKMINTTLRATYAGSFVLPAITCEDMYDVKINARIKSGKAIVE